MTSRRHFLGLFDLVAIATSFALGCGTPPDARTAAHPEAAESVEAQPGDPGDAPEDATAEADAAVEVGASEEPAIEAASPATEPEVPADPNLAFLSQTTVTTSYPTEPPSTDDWRTRRAGEWRSQTSPDGRSVLVEYPGGMQVLARLEGPPLPEGASARLLPVSVPSSSTAFVLYFSPLGRLVPYISGAAWELRRSERAVPGERSAERIDERALDRTVVVRAGPCPETDVDPETGERQECFYYGDEARLARRDQPPGGYRATWFTASRRLRFPFQDPSPYEYADPGLFIAPQTDASLADDYSPPAVRVTYEVGSRHVHLMDLQNDPAEMGAGFYVHTYGDERIVALHYAEGLEFTMARVDTRRARRVGPSLGMSATPIDGEIHGGVYVDMFPVLLEPDRRGARALGVAMGFSLENVLLFRPRESNGRWVPGPDSAVVLGNDPEAANRTRTAGSRHGLHVLERCGPIPCIRPYVANTDDAP